MKWCLSCDIGNGLIDAIWKSMTEYGLIDAIWKSMTEYGLKDAIRRSVDRIKDSFARARILVVEEDYAGEHCSLS